MAWDREVRTGRAFTLKVSGRIALKYCGGRSVSSPADGWQGSNYFYTSLAPFQQSQITADLGFGAGVEIVTQQLGSPNPAHDGDPSSVHFQTSILFSGRDPGTGLSNIWDVAEWYNDADPTWDDSNPTLTPPAETIEVTFISTLDCEEWAQEAFHPAGVRPEWAGGIHRVLRLKPTGNVHTTLTYPGGTFSQDVLPLVSSLTDRTGYLAETRATFADIGIDATGDPSSAYQLDIEYIGASMFEPHFTSADPVVATANGLDFDGGQRWYGTTYGGFDHPITDPRGASGFTFQVPTGERPSEVLSAPDYTSQAVGTVRDWNGPLTGIPVGTYDLDTATEILTLSRTGAQGITGNRGVLLPFIRTGWLGDHNYNPDDHDSLVMKQGTAWNVLRLDRDASLTALDFGVTPSGHSWSPTDCTATPSGTSLVVAATGGTPSISRTMKNDLLDIAADPASWFAANGASIDSRFLLWHQGESGGPTLTKNGPGDWRRIGRRLLSTSDVFNWHPWRYLDLVGKADAPCTVTLIVTWQNIQYDGSSIITTARTATYKADLTTTTEAHTIDLPSVPNNEDGLLVGHDGLRCVTAIEVKVPAGRTVTLARLMLKEKARPVLDCHLVGHGSGDDPALVSALGDGKAILWNPAESVWGQPAKDTDGSSLLLLQYATEIALQEGWSATVAGTPDDGSPNYAINLEEVFETPLPATLKARRGYGALAYWPQSGQSVEVLGNLGNAIQGLLFDPDTHLPARTVVGAFRLNFYKQPGTVFTAEEEEDATTSDAVGHFRLELVNNGPEYELRSSPGTANQIIFPAHITTGGEDEPQPFAVLSRTWFLAAFGGKGSPHTGGGPVVLDIDRIGNAWITFADANAVKLGRRLGSADHFEILDVGAIGADPWLHCDETDPNFPINVVFGWGADTIYLAQSRANGLGGWRLRQIATGSHPFIRKDKAVGLTFYLYWSGGNVYLKRSQDDGATFLEAPITVLSGVPEQTATMDWRLDDDHTAEVVYFDGTDIQSITSTDNGLHWS